MSHHLSPWPNLQKSQGMPKVTPVVRGDRKGRWGPHFPAQHSCYCSSTASLCWQIYSFLCSTPLGINTFIKVFSAPKRKIGMDFVPDWPLVLTEFQCLPHQIVEMMRGINNPNNEGLIVEAKWNFGDPKCIPISNSPCLLLSNLNGIWVLASSWAR